MTASWQTDPTGRHQVRWWDGQNWTDHVADNGVTATDPLNAAPTAPAAPSSPANDGQGTVVFSAQPTAPVQPTAPAQPAVPSAPSASTSPASAPGSAPSYLGGGPAPSTAVGSTPKKKAPLVPIIGGVVAAIVLIVVLVFVVGGGGNDGPRTVTGDIRDEETLTLAVSGDAGDVIIVDGRPDDDGLDLVIALLVTRDQLRDFYDFGSDITGSDISFSDFESQFDSADDLDLSGLDGDFEDGVITQETDSRGDGERERGYVVLPSDGDFFVVAFAYDGFGSGEVELSIERCSDRADLEDLVEAEDSDEEFDIVQDACGDTRVPYNS